MPDMTLIKSCVHVHGDQQLDRAFRLTHSRAQPLLQVLPDELFSPQAAVLRPQAQHHLLQNGCRVRTDNILKLAERKCSLLLRSKWVFGGHPKQEFIMSCLLSLDPVCGYCKAREISDIVASDTWLLQGTRNLRHCCIWHMAVARYEYSPRRILQFAHGCCKAPKCHA